MNSEKPKQVSEGNFIQRYLLNRKRAGVEESLTVRVKKFREMAFAHTWDKQAEKDFNYCMNYFTDAKKDRKNYEILKPALLEWRTHIYDALHGNSIYTEDEFQKKMKLIPEIDLL